MVGNEPLFYIKKENGKLADKTNFTENQNSSITFKDGNVGFIIYRVSQSIHAILAITYYSKYGITIQELFKSKYVDYTTNDNTISFTAGGYVYFFYNVQ